MRALYIHIPFCRKLCPFCTFAVRKNRPSLHEDYLDALIQEMELRVHQWGPWSKALRSIYVGGGTPSSLNLKEAERLINALKKYFFFSGEMEIAWELNPEDVSQEYISGLQGLGINRVSLGGQSFNTSTLHKLGRLHSAKHFHQAIHNIELGGITNYNVDLMFGIPGQSFEMFTADLQTLLQYEPAHISLYCLEVHARTAFGHQPEVLAWTQENIALFEHMYLAAIETLASARYHHYEVSNFSRPGKQSRSNMLVWSGADYLGIGSGAHSTMGHQRWGNTRSASDYIRRIQQGEEFLEFHETLRLVQKANEFLMLALRQPSGIHVGNWESRFGVKWSLFQQKLAERFYEEGLAYRPDGATFALTPKGLLLADAITERLMITE
ncbi:MAG: radical SAM family heme chaperone HemW [SAR324 cluster bacterium]|nr:radical SAM family heme chaperone HemW [SAR324 cluster bacterium]